MKRVPVNEETYEKIVKLSQKSGLPIYKIVQIAIRKLLNEDGRILDLSPEINAILEQYLDLIKREIKFRAIALLSEFWFMLFDNPDKKLIEIVKETIRGKFYKALRTGFGHLRSLIFVLDRIKSLNYLDYRTKKLLINAVIKKTREIIEDIEKDDDIKAYIKFLRFTVKKMKYELGLFSFLLWMDSGVYIDSLPDAQEKFFPHPFIEKLGYINQEIERIPPTLIEGSLIPTRMVSSVMNNLIRDVILDEYKGIDYINHLEPFYFLLSEFLKENYNDFLETLKMYLYSTIKDIQDRMSKRSSNSKDLNSSNYAFLRKKNLYIPND